MDTSSFLPKPIIEPNAVYTREEAAHVLGVSLSTLKHLIREGHLVVSQPPGIRRIFIRGSSIVEMLDRTARSSPIAAAAIVDGRDTLNSETTHDQSRALPQWRGAMRQDSTVSPSRREPNHLHPAPRAGKKVQGGANE